MKDFEGKSAILWASRRGRDKVVAILLDKKAKINDFDSFIGFTALHQACFCGHFKLAELLIGNGASIDERSSANLTPLHPASQLGFFNIVQLLIDNHANVHARTLFESSTALHLAAAGGYLNVVEILIDRGGANVNQIRNSLIITIIEACSSGNGELVRFLVSRGAKVKYAMKDGNTPLHIASFRGYRSIALFLIENDAELDFKSNYGETPFSIISLRGGTTELMDLFLERGADIQNRDRYGDSLLHKISRWGTISQAKILIKRGINIDGLNERNLTPLSVAYSSDNIGIADLLIESGADETKVDLCPVCIKPFSGRLDTTFCNHSFHYGCLESWKISGNRTCPTCRHDLFSIPA